jgi:DNA-binding transcriptional MerR regulator
MQGLMTIGEFARRCRLTVVALRHYDKEGLLRPAEVDPRNGYRYYGPDQLTIALQLALLRRLDVPVDELRLWVDGVTSLDDLLARQRARLARERDERDGMIAVIDALGASGLHQYDIVRTIEPPRRGVALSFDASWARLEQATRFGLGRLSVALSRAVAPTGALFPVNPGEKVVLTVFALDDAEGVPISVGAPLERLALPSVDVLTTVHRGDHRLLGYAYRALLDQVAVRGLDVVGPVREHYGEDDGGGAGTRRVVPVG